MNGRLPFYARSILGVPLEVRREEEGSHLETYLKDLCKCNQECELREVGEEQEGI